MARNHKRQLARSTCLSRPFSFYAFYAFFAVTPSLFTHSPVRTPHTDTPLFACAVNVTANAFALLFH